MSTMSSSPFIEEGYALLHRLPMYHAIAKRSAPGEVDDVFQDAIVKLIKFEERGEPCTNLPGLLARMVHACAVDRTRKVFRASSTPVPDPALEHDAPSVATAGGFQCAPGLDADAVSDREPIDPIDYESAIDERRRLDQITGLVAEALADIEPRYCEQLLLTHWHEVPTRKREVPFGTAVGHAHRGREQLRSRTDVRQAAALAFSWPDDDVPVVRLADLSWIGPGRAEKLAAKGISTIEDLATASVVKVARAVGDPIAAVDLVDMANAITKPKPRSAIARLEPLPAESRRKGLTHFSGGLEYLRSVLHRISCGVTRPDLVHLISSDTAIKPASVGMMISTMTGELGVLRRDGDTYKPTPAGRSIAATGDPDALQEWLLTRVLGVDVAVAHVAQAKTSGSALKLAIQAANPGWSGLFVPTAIVWWLRQLELIDHDGDGFVPTTRGAAWARRIHWTPARLAIS